MVGKLPKEMRQEIWNKLLRTPTVEQYTQTKSVNFCGLVCIIYLYIIIAINTTAAITYNYHYFLLGYHTNAWVTEVYQKKELPLKVGLDVASSCLLNQTLTEILMNRWDSLWCES